MDSGKRIRMGRFLDSRSGRGIIVPMDHGFTMGPLPGISNSREIAGWLGKTKPQGVIVHRGLLERLANRDVLAGLGVMVHLNGMSNMAEGRDDKVPLTSVRHAIAIGADAVSLQVNFTTSNDAANWSMLARITAEAQAFGLPTLAMVYDKAESKDELPRMRHLLRSCLELGIDAVKLAPPSDNRILAGLVDCVAEDLPIFLAGGDANDVGRYFRQVKQWMSLGITGLCVGRNVFAKPRPDLMLAELSRLVHGQEGLRLNRIAGYGAGLHVEAH